jgi:drug/metabolite transporter (DMT)-like permease
MEKVYIYALGANLSFAVGVQFFTHYAKSHSSLWVNCFKAVVATALFALTVYLQGGFHPIGPGYILLFFASGMLGLGAGDIFLIKSFSLMGPGRTMMLFGFQPLLIGVLSYFLFGQAIDAGKFTAIFFFIICLFIFSLESFKRHGHWNVKASVFALCGIVLDAAGVMITRYTFNNNPGIATTEGNFYRAAGAVILFVVLSRFRPFNFFKTIRALNSRNMFLVTLGSFMGTYLSLMLYLNAVRYAGTLAAVSGIAITGTIFASIFECALNKRLPSAYLVVSFAFFLMGMKFLFF